MLAEPVVVGGETVGCLAARPGHSRGSAWAIRRGLDDVAGLRDTSPSLGLSLNISARQVVDPALPAVITAALSASGLSAPMLTLEITESLLMEDPVTARAQLTALKDLGVRLSIDDFGTGYSSLSYLRDFPVDQVKIDRSFVIGLRPDAHDDIAVGQLGILTGLGCDLGQGFYFSPPIPPGNWHDDIRATVLAAQLAPRATPGSRGTGSPAAARATRRAGAGR